VATGGPYSRLHWAVLLLEVRASGPAVHRTWGQSSISIQTQFAVRQGTLGVSPHRSKGAGAGYLKATDSTVQDKGCCAKQGKALRLCRVGQGTRAVQAMARRSCCAGYQRDTGPVQGTSQAGCTTDHRTRSWRPPPSAASHRLSTRATKGGSSGFSGSRWTMSPARGRGRGGCKVCEKLQGGANSLYPSRKLTQGININESGFPTCRWRQHAAVPPSRGPGSIGEHTGAPILVMAPSPQRKDRTRSPVSGVPGAAPQGCTAPPLAPLGVPVVQPRSRGGVPCPLESAPHPLVRSLGSPLVHRRVHRGATKVMAHPGKEREPSASRPQQAPTQAMSDISRWICIAPVKGLLPAPGWRLNWAGAWTATTERRRSGGMAH